jgi:hypothetical protein
MLGAIILSFNLLCHYAELHYTQYYLIINVVMLSHILMSVTDKHKVFSKNVKLQIQVLSFPEKTV